MTNFVLLLFSSPKLVLHFLFYFYHLSRQIATIKALRRLERYMREFLAFEHIWTTDKESFFKNYKKLNPSAADFNRDMIQYVVFFPSIKYYFLNWSLWSLAHERRVKRSTWLNRYSVYKRKILDVKPVAQVAHFLVQTDALKAQIVHHCDEWKDRFSCLLLEMTTDLIDGLYRFAQANSQQYAIKTDQYYCSWRLFAKVYNYCRLFFCFTESWRRRKT